MPRVRARFRAGVEVGARLGCFKAQNPKRLHIQHHYGIRSPNAITGWSFGTQLETGSVCGASGNGTFGGVSNLPGLSVGLLLFVVGAGD